MFKPDQHINLIMFLNEILFIRSEYTNCVCVCYKMCWIYKRSRGKCVENEDALRRK